MYNKENKKCIGILQDLSNRVKANKSDNIKIIKRGMITYLFILVTKLNISTD